jgi:hypothetical protein
MHVFVPIVLTQHAALAAGRVGGLWQRICESGREAPSTGTSPKPLSSASATAPLRSIEDASRIARGDVGDITHP